MAFLGKLEAKAFKEAPLKSQESPQKGRQAIETSLADGFGDREAAMPYKRATTILNDFLKKCPQPKAPCTLFGENIPCLLKQYSYRVKTRFKSDIFTRIRSILTQARKEACPVFFHFHWLSRRCL
jgi:hypothetical protein